MSAVPVPVAPVIQIRAAVTTSGPHPAAAALAERVDSVAKQINQIELYKDAATASKTPVPKDVMRTSKLMDGVVWDGKDPKKYADSFKVKA